MNQIEGKVALITGASEGIGRAIALALAGYGAKLALNARRAEKLAQVSESLKAKGSQVLAVSGDVSKVKDVERLKSAVLEEFGHVDILVNNVGVGKYGPVVSSSIEDYDWIMNTNMRSSYLVTRAFLTEMLERKEGWVIFIASVAGLRGLPNEAIYCASKCAQVGFAQALDYEVRQHGIKVTVVAPGATKTEFAIGTGRTRGDPKLEEYSDPESTADAVVFALQQPPKTRVFLIGMRPMVEAL